MNLQNNTMGLRILATGMSLPAKIVTNDDLSHMVETDDEWIQSRTGIKQRYVCKEETCTDLALAAAEAAFQKAKKADAQAKANTGVVIVATTTSDYAFPSTACMVKERLGLPDDVMAFDVNAACSGFLYALEIARGLLGNGKKRYAIVIGSEKMSKITDFTDRSTCVLFGDGAGAALVTLDAGTYCHLGFASGNVQTLYCNGVGNKEMYIHMEGSKVFRFAVSVIEQSIREILEKTELTMDEIDHIVCHQANERIIDHVSRKFAGGENKFYKNMERYANTSAASIPIALNEMVEKKMLKEGQKIICVGFGAGFTWSSVLMTIGEMESGI